ncbi:hypothetical protein CBR_g50882 [Chara braunii]|uniref:Uncharacterized protein n=1 Tax=Chara braunii TaxID=69332 RepID=A0A388M7U3_CHABU|nr:hypothetical protein CBR_g50882 [Chara braunii]|eukprot:GBG90539.1 hypothetical protein CBR_g50882 [Chara braunii]
MKQRTRPWYGNTMSSSPSPLSFEDQDHHNFSSRHGGGEGFKSVSGAERREKLHGVRKIGACRQQYRGGALRGADGDTESPFKVVRQQDGSGGGGGGFRIEGAAEKHLSSLSGGSAKWRAHLQNNGMLAQVSQGSSHIGAVAGSAVSPYVGQPICNSQSGYYYPVYRDSIQNAVSEPFNICQVPYSSHSNSGGYVAPVAPVMGIGNGGGGGGLMMAAGGTIPVSRGVFASQGMTEPLTAIAAAKATYLRAKGGAWKDGAVATAAKKTGTSGAGGPPQRRRRLRGCKDVGTQDSMGPATGPRADGTKVSGVISVHGNSKSAKGGGAITGTTDKRGLSQGRYTSKPMDDGGVLINATRNHSLSNLGTSKQSSLISKVAAANAIRALGGGDHDPVRQASNGNDNDMRVVQNFQRKSISGGSCNSETSLGTIAGHCSPSSDNANHADSSRLQGGASRVALSQGDLTAQSYPAGVTDTGPTALLRQQHATTSISDKLGDSNSGLERGDLSSKDEGFGSIAEKPVKDMDVTAANGGLAMSTSASGQAFGCRTAGGATDMGRCPDLVKRQRSEDHDGCSATGGSVTSAMTNHISCGDVGVAGVTLSSPAEEIADAPQLRISNPRGGHDLNRTHGREEEQERVGFGSMSRDQMEDGRQLGGTGGLPLRETGRTAQIVDFSSVERSGFSQFELSGDGGAGDGNKRVLQSGDSVICSDDSLADVDGDNERVNNIMEIADLNANSLSSFNLALGIPGTLAASQQYRNDQRDDNMAFNMISGPRNMSSAQGGNAWWRRGQELMAAFNEREPDGMGGSGRKEGHGEKVSMETGQAVRDADRMSSEDRQGMTDETLSTTSIPVTSKANSNSNGLASVSRDRWNDISSSCAPASGPGPGTGTGSGSGPGILSASGDGTTAQLQLEGGATPNQNDENMMVAHGTNNGTCSGGPAPGEQSTMQASIGPLDRLGSLRSAGNMDTDVSSWGSGELPPADAGSGDGRGSSAAATTATDVHREPRCDDSQVIPGLDELRLADECRALMEDLGINPHTLMQELMLHPWAGRLPIRIGPPSSRWKHVIPAHLLQQATSPSGGQRPVYHTAFHGSAEHPEDMITGEPSTSSTPPSSSPKPLRRRPSPLVIPSCPSPGPGP